MNVLKVVRKYLIRDLTELTGSYYTQTNQAFAPLYGQWWSILPERAWKQWWACSCHTPKQHMDIAIWIDDDTYTHCLKDACKGGHMDIARFMMKNGAHCWNNALMGACEEGHMELVLMMIEKGANQWDWAYESACEGGHMEIVKLIEEKLINDFDNVERMYREEMHDENAKYNMYNSGLYGACLGGHLHLVKRMIEKGATDFHWGFECARNIGHLNIVKYILKQMDCLIIPSSSNTSSSP